MLLLLTYDICTDDDAGKRRLQRVAKLCEANGTRVQDSVFEMRLDPRMLEQFKLQLLEEIDVKEDSVRIYHLSKHADERTEKLGIEQQEPQQDIFLIE